MSGTSGAAGVSFCVNMRTDKPLKVAVCTKCGVKFFVDEFRPGPYGGEVRTYDAAPPSSKEREIVPVKCPRCGHDQFAEFDYGF